MVSDDATLSSGMQLLWLWECFLPTPQNEGVSWRRIAQPATHPAVLETKQKQKLD